MPNLRIVSDNAADRATISASSTAGSLGPTNLQTDSKGTVHRASGTSVVYGAVFAALEPVSAVALLGNYSPDATMRVGVTNEPSVTNMLTYSSQFDNAVWTKTRATVTANVAGVAAPDGSTTVDKLCNNGIVDSNGYIKQSFTADGVSSYAVSVFVKSAGEITVAQIDIVQNNGSAFLTGARAMLDFTTGTLSGVGNGLSKVIAYPNGWYRIIAAGVPSVGTAELRISLPADAGSSTTGFYMWGAQVEIGSAATSYYPTVAAAAARPLGFMDAWQNYNYDSGTVPACPAQSLVPRGWTAAQAASAYAFGGGAYARLWLSKMNAYAVRVQINDPGNLQGYVEAWRMVIGDYWSPTNNPEWGADLLPLDQSKNSRMISGDLVSQLGTRARKLTLPMGGVPPADRKAIMNLMRANGTSYPHLVSLFPEDADAENERDHMLWAKLSSLSAMKAAMWQRTTASLEFEEA